MAFLNRRKSNHEQVPNATPSSIYKNKVSGIYCKTLNQIFLSPDPNTLTILDPNPEIVPSVSQFIVSTSASTMPWCRRSTRKLQCAMQSAFAQFRCFHKIPSVTLENAEPGSREGSSPLAWWWFGSEPDSCSHNNQQIPT